MGGFRCSASLDKKIVSHGESKIILVLHPYRMKPRSIGCIPSAVFALAKVHSLVSHQLHPGSRAPIGVSSSTAASASTSAFGPLIAAIVTGTIRVLIHIRFPVAHDLCFILILLTIWE